MIMRPLKPDFVNDNRITQPSGDDGFLSTFLKQLSITDTDSILDIGCGKGSAMNVMREFPFTLIAGVELLKDVARIADKNFQIIGDSRCFIYCHDAVDFPQYGIYNYYYMYNPFNYQTMEKVITKINQSIKNLNRERFIIYYNPEYHDLIVNMGWVKIKEFPSRWSLKIFVYSNRSV
jgi:tRNA1(Val) A37 N6-methylase TrmN6